MTGGLGQIGSHVMEMQLARRDQDNSVDNLATGRRERVAEHRNQTVVIESIANRSLTDQIVGDFWPDAVVHAAASY